MPLRWTMCLLRTIRQKETLKVKVRYVEVWHLVTIFGITMENALKLVRYWFSLLWKRQLFTQSGTTFNSDHKIYYRLKLKCIWKLIIKFLFQWRITEYHYFCMYLIVTSTIKLYSFDRAWLYYCTYVTITCPMPFHVFIYIPLGVLLFIREDFDKLLTLQINGGSFHLPKKSNIAKDL